MLADVHPAPSDEERAVILAAVGAQPEGDEEGWSAAALLEGVADELDP